MQTKTVIDNAVWLETDATIKPNFIIGAAPSSVQVQVQMPPSPRMCLSMLMLTACLPK